MTPQTCCTTYSEDRYVAAALELFASVALMLWYVLRFPVPAANQPPNSFKKPASAHAGLLFANLYSLHRPDDASGQMFDDGWGRPGNTPSCAPRLGIKMTGALELMAPCQRNRVGRPSPCANPF